MTVYEQTSPMEKNSNCICFDGNIISAEKPVAPVASCGLMYGDGVFDTLRVYSGHTLRWNEHWNRTRSGLNELGIVLPDHLDSNRLQLDIKKLLNKENLTGKDAIIRLQFWRDGNRGYQPTANADVHYSITASACPAHFDHPRLVTVDKRRIPSAALSSKYKFTNGINYILAAREAAEKEGDGALMQTIAGSISETTIANIFWRKGVNIFTPSAECDLLPGITRDIFMNLIRNDDKLTLQTGKFPLDHILEADAVWMSNSVRELLPVQRINQQVYDSEDEIYSGLKQRFREYRDEHLIHLP